MALNVGVIGAGNIARIHLGILADVPEAQAIGIYDVDAERARQAADRHGIPRVYDSWRQLLDDANVQAVAILLPHDLHHRFVVEAVEAGKHVVCEKPLAPTVAECREMLAAAERAGVHLFPVHNRVYDYAAERMRDLLRDGAIGDVFLVQTNGFEGPQTVGVRPWLATKSGGGGVLMAQAVHPAYILRWLLGDATRVSCLFGSRRRVDMTSEDTAVAVIQFASGVLAEMTATFGIAHGPFDHAIMIHGSDGYLELRSAGGRSGRPHLLHAISPKLFGDKDLHEVEVAASESWATGFRRLWTDYAAAIGEGAEPRVTGIDGLRAVEIIEAAYRSQQSGSAIDLPL